MKFFSTILSLTIVATAARVANAEADPLAFAKAQGVAIADDDSASYDCHSNCGYAILAARKCSPDGNSDSDYNSTCLCEDSETFLSLAPQCLDCGWCLWSDYAEYLTSAFSECGFSTQPTGTDCAAEKTSYIEEYGTAAVTNSNTTAASYYASQYADSSYSANSTSITETSFSNSTEETTVATSAISTESSSSSSSSSSAIAATNYMTSLGPIALAISILLM
ncbi:hypothetical protein FOA43_003238 [Brettanomyces nanus]|uniref:Uncharacterized protein n=1 Tax=Eeniella nana TaxID=13502 RepID=A0A875SA12_EENNA|nr:uncharacterized protein FOA43_003238 [Brettanomyces nanus]QPG75854.1 hypothetical protein FOA43_003238 [Brettanomyces nanus]